ncbi:MAG: S8 family serine peptidase [Chloroflexota bacterium]
MKRINFFAAALLLLALFAASMNPAQARAGAPAFEATWHTLEALESPISSVLHARLGSLAADEKLTVIVRLRQQANLPDAPGLSRPARQRATLQALRTTADLTQRSLKTRLKFHMRLGRVSAFSSFWVFNGLSVTASADVIRELAAHPDVLSILPDDVDVAPASDAGAFTNPEANLALVNAPALWSSGISGQGVVVASMDTGVSLSHPDLAAQWRGGANSWYDPYGEHPTTPSDTHGHGTGTMGVILAGDGSGASLGLAPASQWIAVKIFNDSGSATSTAIHSGYQWLLDPDGDPNTADAPAVVNNSWGFTSPGCFLDFEPDLQALRAAGILPVFSAGNGGPGTMTSFSPANNPSAFAVGATDNSDVIASLSSRGPTSCGGSTGVFPELTAPGVNLHILAPGGQFDYASGTSLAAPHVTGGLALLLSAYPGLSPADLENSLLNTAVDLGDPGPDDTYGYGRLDLLAAYNWLTVNVTPTALPTATPTATYTPTPTNTPTNTPTPTDTPTHTPTPTDTPTQTPLPTDTPTSTATSSPTATYTPLPSPTATQPPKVLHIADLDGNAIRQTRYKWKAVVRIVVRDGQGKPVANAKVFAKWTVGVKGAPTCITNSNGVCWVTRPNIPNKVARVRLTITKVTRWNYTYNPLLNTDPDGSSNGRTILVKRP